MTKRRAERANAPLPSPPPPERARPVFAANEPFIVFAYATLTRELDGLAAARPRNPASPTSHEVHQLRVAARRLRVALRVFRRLLPSAPAARLRAELRWFANALGEARDLDVYSDHVHAYARELPPEQQRALGAYELYLRRERAEARNRLAAVFSAPRYLALLDTTTSFLANGPSAGALRRWRSLATSDGVRQGLRKSFGRVRRLGNRLAARATARELHELRIRAKRLRYELEFFAHAFARLAPYATTVKRLQDLLGEHQDVYAGNARLRRYAAALRAQTGTALPRALAELRRSELRRARDLRRSFATGWRNFLAAVRDAPRSVS